MRRIIINADDCGMSKQVNEHIEQAILAGKITSTTVMANMDDFEGAVQLYKDYGLKISFGWHINLTEGCPLTSSQLLLDKGFFVERDGRVEMNGKAYWKKRLSSDMRSEIRKELMAQYTQLKDSGIAISHVDSHHHIHTAQSMTMIIPSVLKEIGVNKVRRMRNNVPGLIRRFPRQAWGWVYKMQNTDLVMTDVFCYFKDFATHNMHISGKTMEMECHPGHPKYEAEERMLMAQNYDNNMQLISYNEL